MKWIKYILRWVEYLLTQSLFLFFCFLTKFGVAKKFYQELEISRDLGACNKSYRRKNYEDCLEIYNRYKNCESVGCSGIKYIAALMYYYGYGVSLNRKKSLELFDELAALGDIEAKLFLKQFEVNIYEEK